MCETVKTSYLNPLRSVRLIRGPPTTISPNMSAIAPKYTHSNDGKGRQMQTARTMITGATSLEKDPKPYLEMHEDLLTSGFAATPSFSRAPTILASLVGNKSPGNERFRSGSWAILVANSFTLENVSHRRLPGEPECGTRASFDVSLHPRLQENK